MTDRLRSVGAALALAVTGALVVLTGAPASAHANLLSTDPEEGAVVQSVPEQIVLTFNEPIGLGSDAVHAFAPDGSDWRVEAEVQDNRLVVTPSADPGDGTAVVSWRVISEDGHEVGGALHFSIGTPSSGAAAAATEPEAPTSVGVGRTAAGVVAVVALLTAVGLVLAGRPRRYVDLAWNAGLVAAVLIVPLQELARDGRGLRGLTDWLVWLDGLARWPSVLLLAAFVAAAGLRAAPSRRVAGLVAVPVLALGAGAIVTWPDLPDPPATATPATDAPTEHVAELGGSGTVELVARGTAGGLVRLDVRLLERDGDALRPFRTPTLVVRSGELSLGEALLRRTGPGRYRTEVTIPRSGEWEAQVSVRTSRFDNPVAVVPFAVG